MGKHKHSIGIYDHFGNRVGVIPGGPCTACEEENQLFKNMESRLGAFGLEAKIEKREPARLYYRAYPYDAWQKREGMDAVDLAAPGTPAGDYVATETRDYLLAGLTPRELEVALWSEQGLKPKDMAAIRGDKTSNADRWMKHRVKLRFQEKMASLNVSLND